MREHHIRRTTIVLLVSATVALAGCASDDDGAAASDTTTAAAANTAVDTTAAESTAPPSTTPDTTVPATTDAPTTTAAATTTAAPTTTTTTVPIDYGQQYLDWVGPSNCALQIASIAESEVIGDDGEFTEAEWPSLRPQLNAIWQEAAAAFVEFIETGVTLTWPEDLQGDINNVIAESSAYGTGLASLGSAETLTQWNNATETLSSVSNPSAAVVRAKLGLESNLAPDDDWCD